jgi:hypothetical protein
MEPQPVDVHSFLLKCRNLQGISVVIYWKRAGEEAAG